MITTILISSLFGFLFGCLGAVCIEVYLQRIAHNEVGEHDAPSSSDTAKRRAG